MKWWFIILLPLQLLAQETYTTCEDQVPQNYQVGYDVNKIYYWNISSGTILSTNNNSITIQWPDSIGTYTISCYTTRFGCEGDTSYYSIIIEDCETIQLFFPNAFTPNSDDHNSVYIVHGRDIDDINYVAIYNRWGQRIFEADENKAWDGTYNGFNCPIGIYILNIMYKDIRFVREIHLIR
ncbi:MAG: gliding motility-associated C-terminal domain-containing protein [Pelagibacterales bacterium]|nr:gliding motility-associated C-terminal domain-containing protein [Pelagibacterales bacterium]